MEKHEVVVVGAGPAGLKAAELLGRAGKDVLVVEKDKEGRIGDKSCAGGLFSYAMKYFPEELYENSINSATFYISGRKHIVNSDEPFGVLVSRPEIGQYQLKLAKEAEAQ